MADDIADDIADENSTAAEFPPVPAVRAISPAPEDYASPPPMRDLLWPLVWVAVAALCLAAVNAVGWSA